MKHCVQSLPGAKTQTCTTSVARLQAACCTQSWLIGCHLAADHSPRQLCHHCIQRRGMGGHQHHVALPPHAFSQQPSSCRRLMLKTHNGIAIRVCHRHPCVPGWEHRSHPCPDTPCLTTGACGQHCSHLLTLRPSNMRCRTALVSWRQQRHQPGSAQQCTSLGQPCAGGRGRAHTKLHAQLLLSGEGRLELLLIAGVQVHALHLEVLAQQVARPERRR